MRTLISVLLLGSAALSQTSAPPTTPPKHEESIVVTGTYGPVPMEEADRSIDSIEVNQSPAPYRNWTDVLQQDPSIDVRQRAPGTQADLSIRGSTFGQTLILVNGLRLNDAQTAHNNLDIPFPFESVQRVEVLKGSGSTLYGSDAVGGTVNFVTAVPNTTEARFGAGVGNWGTNQQNGSLSFAKRAFDEQLTFVRELSTGFIYDRDYRNLAVASETGINTALGRSDILLGISDRPFGANGFYGTYPSWERTKGWLAAITQPLGEQTKVSFAYRRHTDEFILFRTKPSVYENNHVIDEYQLAVRRFEKIGDNTRIYYGGEAYRDALNSSNLGVHTRDRGAVYASFDARAWRRFSFTAGAREEVYTGGNNQFSPSASAGYWISSHIKLRGSVSHAFRLPTFTDLYYHDPANIGNPNLRPEEAWSFEGGIQFSLVQNVVADVAVFHRRDHDVIDYVRSSFTSPWMAENIQNLNFTGVEAAVRWQLPHQNRAEFSYTGLHGAQDTVNGLQSEYVFNYPVHAATGTWWSVLPARLESRFRVAALQRFQRDPYPLIEWTVSREWRYMRPYLQLTNLTDTKYQEIPGVPMPGRGFIAGLELRWKAK